MRFKPEPSLLLHPNIPMPMHGVNPRSIKGPEWWHAVQEQTIREQDDRCAACGAKVGTFHGDKQRLECHEVYTVDYDLSQMAFVKVVALCPWCHRFIHSGLLDIHREQGLISESEHREIISHGLDVLDRAGLLDDYYNSLDYLSLLVDTYWDEWRLIFEGREYPPKFASLAEHQAYYNALPRTKAGSFVEGKRPAWRDKAK